MATAEMETLRGGRGIGFADVVGMDKTPSSCNSRGGACALRVRFGCHCGHCSYGPVVQPRSVMTGVRMDKWLWAARFFKTRSLAARACDLGRIECNERPAKSSREVRAGDLLRVKNEAGDFQVEVVFLSEMRGPAAVAQTLYLETEASKQSRLKVAEERQAMRQFEALPEGRPSKRNRRELARFRGRA
jgi:ribosome-associated heat shock protein Hsp15